MGSSNIRGGQALSTADVIQNKRAKITMPSSK
jgi:hypothetical protein